MSNQVQIGLVALVDGQQSYAVVFTPAFAAAPALFTPSLRLANSSAESFDLSYTDLTASGCTVWLNGIPTSASAGSYINWYAHGSVAASSGGSGTGITVPQLFHRMGRRTRTGDYTKLSMSEQTDLCEAATSALQRLYNALPTYFKEQSQGFVLPGPLAITGVGVTQYSKTITGYSFTSAQFGQTVVLDGDAGWNQIIGTDELLNPYMGSTGTANGTIYGNAIHSDTYPLDRIIGNPQFANQNQGPIFFGGIGIGIGNMNTQMPASWLFAQAVGVPQMCWPQVFGNSQGERPIMVLRFAPAPTSAIAINVRMGFWPKRLTLADYEAATMLCVPDQFIEPSLIKMCVQELMGMPLWVTSERDDRIYQAGIDGEAYAKNQAGQIMTPANRVGTPVGW